MKIGWDGLTWLVRDYCPKKNENSPKISEDRPIPDRLVAQVRESLDKDTVLLRWGDRDIRCRVDTPVQKGEHLLLQFKEWSEKKQFFKVLARSFYPMLLDSERSNVTLHVLLPGFKGMPLPLLLRIQRYIKENENEHERHASGETADNNAKLSFELIIETETLGVVIIKIEKQQQYYTGRLLVETVETGKFLEEELYELQKYAATVLQEKNIKLKALGWEVVPTWDLQKIREDLRQISFILDRKV